MANPVVFFIFMLYLYLSSQKIKIANSKYNNKTIATIKFCNNIYEAQNVAIILNANHIMGPGL